MWYALIVADPSNLSGGKQDAPHVPATRGALPTASPPSSSSSLGSSSLFSPIRVIPLSETTTTAIGKRSASRTDSQFDNGQWIWRSNYFSRSEAQLSVALKTVDGTTAAAVVTPLRHHNPTFVLRRKVPVISSASAASDEPYWFSAEPIAKGAQVLISKKVAETCFRQLSTQLGAFIQQQDPSAVSWTPEALYAHGSAALTRILQKGSDTGSSSDASNIRFLARCAADGDGGALFSFPTHVTRTKTSTGAVVDVDLLNPPKVMILHIPAGTSSSSLLLGASSVSSSSAAATTGGAGGVTSIASFLHEAEEDEVASHPAPDEGVRRLASMRLLERALDDEAHRQRSTSGPLLVEAAPASRPIAESTIFHNSTVVQPPPPPKVRAPQQPRVEAPIAVGMTPSSSSAAAPPPQPPQLRKVPSVVVVRGDSAEEDDWLAVMKPPTTTAAAAAAPLITTSMAVAAGQPPPQSLTAAVGAGVASRSPKVLTTTVTTTPSASSCYQWEWKCHVDRDDHDDSAWRPYSKKDSDLLETAFLTPNAKGQFVPTVAVSATHMVCFHDVHVGMAQYQKADPSKWRSVRRRRLTGGGTAGAGRSRGKDDDEGIPEGRRRAKRQRILRNTGLSTDEDSSDDSSSSRGYHSSDSDESFVTSDSDEEDSDTSLDSDSSGSD